MKFGSPLGLSRDAHWDDAWTDPYTNEYVLPHPYNEFKKLRAGRASELGKTVSNTFTLNRWHKEMVLRGLLIKKSLLGRAAIALATKAKPSSELWKICKEAEDVAGAKEPAALGTNFHEYTELFDARKITLDEVPEPFDKDLLAYAELLTRTGIVPVPEFTEQIIWNEPLNVCGRYDRLWKWMRHCDRWHVGDLKTGRFIDYGWHENPIQLQVYATASHQFSRVTEKWSPMPETCQELGLILHIPSDGKKDESREPTGNRMAALYEVDLTTRIQMPVEWDLVTGLQGVTPAGLAKAVQAWQKTKRIAKLVARVEVTPDGEVMDSPLSTSELIDMYESREEIEALWGRLKEAGAWHGGHTRRAKARIAELAS